MIASKSFRRTCTVVALLGLTLGTAQLSAYTYQWMGGSTGVWNDDSGSWTRFACGSPCYEYPGTGDDAVIPDDVTFGADTFTSDDLSISDSDVRFGPTGSGYCIEVNGYTFDSVTISASSGQTAQLRG